MKFIEIIKDEYINDFSIYGELDVNIVKKLLNTLIKPIQLTQLNQFNQQIQTYEHVKTLNTTEKGEKLVEKISKYLNDFNVKNVSNIPYNGDLRLNEQIMIECKNYNNIVPYEQVEKFYRDISLRNIKSGMFITTNQIANIGNFSFIYHNKESEIIPIVFININVFQDENAIIDILNSLIKLLLTITNINYVTITENDILLLNSINIVYEDINLCKNSMMNTYNTITMHYFNLNGMLSNLSLKVKQIIDKLTDKCSNSDVLNTITNNTNINSFLLNDVITHINVVLKDKIKPFNKNNTNIDIVSNSANNIINIKILATKIKITFNLYSVSLMEKHLLTTLDNVKIEKNKVHISINKENISIIKKIIDSYII
jgi:hypothetical protein